MSQNFSNPIIPTKLSTRFQKKVTAKDKLTEIEEKSLRKIDPNDLPATFMYVSISGLIQSGKVLG